MSLLSKNSRQQNQRIDSDNSISPADVLIAPSADRYDYVLANPPFDKKSSQTFTNEEGEQEKEDLTYNRHDFWTTSNKQLNFVQHIRSMLKTTSQAAVVFPDNVLLKAEQERPFAKNCWKQQTCIPSSFNHRYLLRQWCKSKRHLRRQQTQQQRPMDKRNIDLRLPHQHTPHPKKEPAQTGELQDFITCYNSVNRHKRKETYNANTSPECRWRS